MSIIARMLKQAAIYWGPPQDNGEGGFLWPEPVEIRCRWEKGTTKRPDERSNEEVEESTVYVDQDVEVNGYLFLGGLSEVSGQDPDQIQDAKRITDFHSIPNFRATEFLRRAKV
mgnify:CR=1 FL=1